MHPYFIFKDLVTIFAFFLVLSVLVFFYPNLLGRYLWPTLVCLIVHIMVTCAICWKDILFVHIPTRVPSRLRAKMRGCVCTPINRLKYCLQRPNGFSPLSTGGKLNTENTFWLFYFCFLCFLRYIRFCKVSPCSNMGCSSPCLFGYGNIMLCKNKRIGFANKKKTEAFCGVVVVQKVKIYTKTIIVRGLFIIKIFRKYIITTFAFALQQSKAKEINPIIVKYYYKIYNQQITKIINKYLINTFFNTFLLLVGISETIRTKKNDIKNILFPLLAYLGAQRPKGGASGQGVHEHSKKQINTKSNSPKLKIMDKHNNEISLEFKQWFAGLTDGDGYIYVNKNKKGSVGFELTLNSLDEKVLRILQNKFGGNIHPRAGLNAVRYRTQQKDTVYKIIQCLNGLVINNIRLAQLHKACLALNIPILEPQLPDIHSAYISGLFDSEGYINIYKYFYTQTQTQTQTQTKTLSDGATYRYQLTIAISNKSLCNIDFLTNVIGSKIYFDKRLNGHYKWVANSKLLHLNLYDYFLKFPPKTIKKHRTFLIKEFHELNSIKAYLETDKLSVRYKIWQMFNLK
jgi:LAGLIDADG endonuclease